MFESYRSRMARRGNSCADVLQKQSEAVVNATFMQSTSYRQVIVKRVDNGLPQFDEMVDDILDAHFEQHSKYNITGDEVTYWLTFRPHAHKDHSDISVGSYVSIPNCDGDRDTWLIVHQDIEEEQMRYQILLTNHILKWIYKGKIYQTLVCLRNANSYSSGKYDGDRTTKVEDMNTIFAPTNNDIGTIGYDQRFIISEGDREVPICWIATKFQTIAPKGITKIGLSQVAFDPVHDNAALGIASYYSSNIPLEDAPTETEEDDDIVITYNGTKPTIKVGNSKVFTADLMPEDTRTLTWSVTDTDGTYYATNENYTLTTTNRTLELKVAKNYNLIGRLLTIQAEDDDGVAGEVQVEVV